MSLSKDGDPNSAQLVEKRKRTDSKLSVLLWLALPIFPARLQASIFGRSELNFRVRNGNGWTLALISTNLLSFEKESKQRKLHTSFFKKRSVPFSLLTVFFNSKYSIKFSSHCQKLFVLAHFIFLFEENEMVTRTGIEPMFAA